MSWLRNMHYLNIFPYIYKGRLVGFTSGFLCILMSFNDDDNEQYLASDVGADTAAQTYVSDYHIC